MIKNPPKATTMMAIVARSMHRVDFPARRNQALTSIEKSSSGSARATTAEERVSCSPATAGGRDRKLPTSMPAR